MASGRNTWVYRLKSGRRTAYIGITNDPETREAQHREEGKRFGKLVTTGPALTRESAKAREEEMLKNFRSNHDGRNPTYNETDEG